MRRSNARSRRHAAVKRRSQDWDWELGWARKRPPPAPLPRRWKDQRRRRQSVRRLPDVACRATVECAASTAPLPHEGATRIAGPPGWLDNVVSARKLRRRCGTVNQLDRWADSHVASREWTYDEGPSVRARAAFGPATKEPVDDRRARGRPGARTEATPAWPDGVGPRHAARLRTRLGGRVRCLRLRKCHDAIWRAGRCCTELRRTDRCA
jgi:hypothetical protein